MPICAIAGLRGLMLPGPSLTVRPRPASVLVQIIVVAFVLRLLHLRAVLPLELGHPPEVGMDRWLSMHIATAVADGRWLGGWAAPYDSSPGYAYLLAALYRICGRQWLGPLLIQIALGALVPLLVWDVGARLFAPTVGTLAAVIAAIYAPAIFYETLLVKYALLPFVVAAVLACAVRGWEGRGRWWFLAAGLALGALIELRPNNVLTAPVVAGWMVLGGRPPVFRGAASALVVAVLGAALVMVPMAVREQAAVRRGAGSSLWGIHFYIGTNAAADGAYTPVPGVRDDIVGHIVDARAVAERRVGRVLAPSDVSWFWFREGLAFVRQHPGRYALLEVKKAWLALQGDEAGSFGDEFHDACRASWVLRLPLLTFGAICPLAVIGLVAAVRQGRRAALLPLFTAGTMISLLIFFVEGRYRLPLVPPMVILAAAGIDRLAAACHRGRWLAVATGGAIVLTGAVAFAADNREAWLLLVLVILGVSVVSPPRSAAH